MGECKQILYIEDDDYNYLLVARILRSMGGIEVHRAVDGLQGWEAANQILPDLILMDLNLPGLDGWSLTRRLKASPALRAVPVLALTANVKPQERENALAAGCCEYIAKPFNLRDFRERVARHLERAGSG